MIDRFNDERLRRKEQALCAAYLSLLSLKNRELQISSLTFIDEEGSFLGHILQNEVKFQMHRLVKVLRNFHLDNVFHMGQN